MRAFSVSRSTIFPFPSSPHCAPTTMTTDIRSPYFLHLDVELGLDDGCSTRHRPTAASTSTASHATARAAAGRTRRAAISRHRSAGDEDGVRRCRGVDEAPERHTGVVVEATHLAEVDVQAGVEPACLDGAPRSPRDIGERRLIPAWARLGGALPAPSGSPDSSGRRRRSRRRLGAAAPRQNRLQAGAVALGNAAARLAESGSGSSSAVSTSRARPR